MIRSGFQGCASFVLGLRVALGLQLPFEGKVRLFCLRTLLCLDVSTVLGPGDMRRMHASFCHCRFRYQGAGLGRVAGSERRMPGA